MAVIDLFTEGVDNGAERGLQAVSYLDVASRIPEVQAYKHFSVAQLLVARGPFLEIGCGFGAEARALSQLSGQRVFAVDFSQTMVGSALGRSSFSDQVGYAQADGCRLPLADSSFGGCRVDRTLQHVADQAGFMLEIGRVVRPGGVSRIGKRCWSMAVSGV